MSSTPLRNSFCALRFGGRRAVAAAALIAAFVATFAAASAQQSYPRVALSARPGCFADTVRPAGESAPTLTLWERNPGLPVCANVYGGASAGDFQKGEPQSCFSWGTITLARSGGSLADSLPVYFRLSYFSEAGRALPDYGATEVWLPAISKFANNYRGGAYQPAPTAINSLQGDLAPLFIQGADTAIVSVTPPNAVNKVVFPPGVTTLAVTFTARWSDAFAPGGSPRQGTRQVVVALVQRSTYDVAPGAGTAKVLLKDPKNTEPAVLNALPDMDFARNAEGLIEIESPGERPDGLPRSVFGDAEADSLDYGAESSDTTVIQAKIEQSVAYGGRRVLRFTAQTTASLAQKATVKITCSDGRGGTQRDEFVITLVSSLTPSANKGAGGAALAEAEAQKRLSARAAPVFSVVAVGGRYAALVEAEALADGIASCALADATGAALKTLERGVRAGERYALETDMTDLPAGTYSLTVRADGVARVEKFVKPESPRQR